MLIRTSGNLEGLQKTEKWICGNLLNNFLPAVPSLLQDIMETAKDVGNPAYTGTAPPPQGICDDRALTCERTIRSLTRAIDALVSMRDNFIKLQHIREKIALLEEAMYDQHC